MTANAINHYVKGLVDGLQSPFYAPVAAQITNDVQLPSVYAAVDVGGKMLPQPEAWLWASTSRKARQTAPRPVAWAKRTYAFQILLSVVDQADSPNRESAFSCLADSLDIALSTTPLTATIIDPDTSWQSQVLSIGEIDDTEMFLPETMGDPVGSVLRYSYRATVTIIEAQNYSPMPPPP